MVLFKTKASRVFQSRYQTAKKSPQTSQDIAKLSPLLEEVGTIRLKGRLKHSNPDYNVKHPILLTAKHPVVQLLLEKAHRDNLLEGTEYVKHSSTMGLDC